MTFDQILWKLKGCNLTVVAERTGVHRVTLSKLVNDKAPANPHFSTMDALSRYLDGTPYTPDEA